MQADQICCELEKKTEVMITGKQEVNIEISTT